MAMGIISKLLSVGADRQLRRYKEEVARIGGMEPATSALSDEELAAKTAEFKGRLEAGETLADIRDEAFAVVREVSRRTLGMRHFDEQMLCALALDEHAIAEFGTGNGKTLACTPAVYLNALTGRGVHVVTVNDYLATRDAHQMSAIYNFLGLTCACLTNDMPKELRGAAYAADITYGTNTEFGFDYLRDNMVMEASERVQRGHHYAIVDEVDSILIDEARTPLIISGQGHEDLSVYTKFAHAATAMIEGIDFEMDEKKRTIAATEEGLAKMERATAVDIYADESGAMVNHLQNALKAQFMFHRDKDYIIDDGEVKIVDEFTGRVLPGRRWSEGLHQAVEAKEGVEIQQENETLASVTLQNYFRLYEKLSGMTGTAMTEDAEFRKIYDLPVIAIPDHVPNIRVDHDDKLYIDMDHKIAAIADEVAARHAKGQPVLVGTASIEGSERISRALSKRGVPHNVLNAKHHAAEAHIVAQAGRLGAVTVATNMAGRGTDIMLGGNVDMMVEDHIRELGFETVEDAPTELVDTVRKQMREVREHEKELVEAAGGLIIIGSERHEARRIDNQLRGRSARQGDPGETVFFLSFDDDLLRLFGDERMESTKNNLRNVGFDGSEPIQMRSMSRLIEGSQHRVEDANFEMRKRTLEYDDIVDKQRKTIYAERASIVDGYDVLADATRIVHDIVAANVYAWMPKDATSKERDKDAVIAWVKSICETDIDHLPDDPDAAIEIVTNLMTARLFEHVEGIGHARMAPLARRVMLRVMDTRWRTYLQELDYLKSGIGLRSFGQRDPLVEYKREAYAGFESLVLRMYEDFVRVMLHLELRPIAA